MTDSPAVHVVVQATRLTGLAYGINPTGFRPGGRIFIGPDDQAGLTLELDSVEAAARLLGMVEDLVFALRAQADAPAPALPEPAVLIRPAGPDLTSLGQCRGARARRVLALVGRPS